MGEMSEKAKLFTAFWNDYYTRTERFAQVDIGAEWWKLSLKHPELTAPIAASWARLGYLPGKAAPLIADGVTPAMVREMERHAEKAAGGRDELAAERIRQMVEAGEIVDPARVIRVQDPTDPNREIIAIRDDPDQR